MSIVKHLRGVWSPQHGDIGAGTTPEKPRAWWVRPTFSFAVRGLLVGFGTYMAVDAARVLGYPTWALVAFGVLGGLIFVVQVRSELGRFGGRRPSKGSGWPQAKC